MLTNIRASLTRFISHRSTHVVIIASVTIISFAIVLWLNTLFATTADDYCRAGLSSIWSILERTYIEYVTWSGRFVVVFVTYAFLSDPPWSIYVFDIVNAGVFIALIAVIFYCAHARWPSRGEDTVDLAVITALVWGATQNIAESALWKTGSINYLWGVTGEFFVLAVFLHPNLADRFAASKRASIIFCVFAFAIATFIENASIVVTAALIYFYVEGNVLGYPLPRVLRWAALAHGMGTVALFSAPGNYKRAEFEFIPTPIFDRFETLITNFVHVLTNQGWGLVLCAAFLMGLLGTARNDAAPLLRRAAIFLGLSLCFVLVLTPAPVDLSLTGRTAFASYIALIAAAAALFAARPRQFMTEALIAVFAVSSLVSAWIDAARDYRFMNRQFAERSALISRAKALGADHVTVEQLRLKTGDYVDNQATGHMFLWDIATDPKGGINECVAKLNSLKEITGATKPVILDESLAPSEARRSTNGVATIIIGRTIFYSMPGAQCADIASRDRFFLHVFPSRLSSIAPLEREFGFENHDFDVDESHQAVALTDRGDPDGTRCVLYARLPLYPFKKIETGQYRPESGERTWQETVRSSPSGGK